MKIRILFGLVILVAAAASAWAFEMRAHQEDHGNKTIRAKEIFVINEDRDVLFGETPARVEVTNFPLVDEHTEKVVTLLDGVAVPVNGDFFPERNILYTPVVATENFRHVELFGTSTVMVSVRCAFSLEMWNTLSDSVPKSTKGMLIGHKGVETAGQQDLPLSVMGKFFGCGVRDGTSSGSGIVTLVARFTK